jgi:hypothetical protein
VTVDDYSAALIAQAIAAKSLSKANRFTEELASLLEGHCLLQWKISR